MLRILTPITILFALVFCLSAGGVSATEYGFPMALRLGAGINPADPTEPLPYCFDYKSRQVSGSQGVTSFRTRLVRNRKEFLREMNVSASAAGTYAFFSGSANVSVDEKFSFSSDSVTWVVTLQSDFGRAEIYDEVLKPIVGELLANKQYSLFATRCGTELVTQERRQATVAAIFTMKNVSSEQKTILESSFSGQASAGVWNLEASSSYRNFVEEAAKSSRISVDVVTVGGHGASDLAPLITDYGDLNQISGILRSYVTQITFETATATSYLTTKMSRYGWDGNTIDVSATDISLSDYYIAYRDADAVKQRAYNYISMASQSRIRLTNGQLADMEDALSMSDRLVKSIVETAKQCRSDMNKCLPINQFLVAQVKWPKTDPVGTLELTKKTVNCQVAPSPIESKVKFLCTQKSIFLAMARWAEVSGVDAKDRFGQQFTPIQGATTSLTDAYKAAKSKFGDSLTEPQYLELATGESFRTIAEAESKGWGARDLSINFAFGAQSSNTTGLRMALSFSFLDAVGLATERQVFMY